MQSTGNGRKQPPVTQLNSNDQANGSQKSNNKGKGQRVQQQPRKKAGNGVQTLSDASVATRKEQEISQEDDRELMQRHAIIEKLQEQIVRKGESGTASEEEIMSLVHGYVSTCHNATMALMEKQESRAAGRVLRICEEFIGSKVPRSVDILCKKRGVMHTILNNMAQHANMMADMDRSIGYLEAALESAKDPLTDKDQLPLAETYLNLANGYCYMNRFQKALANAEKALTFAHNRCQKIRHDLQTYMQRPPQQQDPKAIENFELQLNDFIAIKIMSSISVGEQHEKLGSYSHAIKCFSDGRSFAEQNFGTKHPLYTKCVNAMGGARLKSKYQTKEVYRTKGGEQVVKEALPNVIHQKKESPKRSVVKMAPPSRASSSTGKKRPRRNIEVAKELDVRKSHQSHQDNILLTNCDSWAQVHCSHNHKGANHATHGHQIPRRPQSGKKRSALTHIVMQRQKERNKIRPSSSFSARKMSGRVAALTHDVLDTITDKRTPYKVVCKIGPGCKNHDWNLRSPLKKVCTRGPNCQNHDWECQGGMQSFGGRNEMNRSHRSEQVINLARTEDSKTNENASSHNTSIHANDPPKSEAAADNKSDHSGNCMMMQSERLHHQQMQHMRSVQEDQFKMLQLVMEQSQKSQNNSQNQNPNQQMMYYPQQQQMPMYPQYPYPHMPQMMQYPPYYGHPQQPYPGMSQQNFYGHRHTDSEYTHTESELSAEEIHRKKQTYGGHEYDEYGEESDEMLRDKNIDLEAAQIKLQTQSVIIESDKIESKNSRKSDVDELRKIESMKVFANDDELNNRATISSKGQNDFQQRRSSAKEKEHVLMKNQSVQYSFKQDTISQSLKSKDISISHTPIREKSIKSEHSHKSYKSVKSSLSEKSFRVEQKDHYSKKEAAVLIQKNFRAYKCREDYRLASRSATQRVTIFKMTIKGNNSAKTMTCALKSQRGNLQALLFYFSGKRSAAGSVEIDLTHYDHIDSYDLKSRVIRIIEEALSQEDLSQAIINAFNTERAAKILLERSSPQKSERFKSISGTKDQKRIDDRIDKASELEIRRMQVEEEIERIRKAANSQQFVQMEKVTVKGTRKSRFSDRHESDENDEQIDNLSDDAFEPDFKVKPVVIKEATVRKYRRGEQAAEDNNSSGYESQTSFKFMVEDQRRPVLVQRKMNIYTLIKVQSMFRGFLARRERNGMFPKILYNKMSKHDNQMVNFKLIKRGFLEYTLSAQMKLGSKAYKETRLEQLPFDEDETLEMFEDCLYFQYANDEIKQLDLRKQTRSQTPSPPLGDHLFILKWNDPEEFSHKPFNILIKTFNIKDDFECQFSYNYDGEIVFYTVKVNHKGLSDYVKLSRLPVEMMYMAYYLQEAVGVKMAENNQLDFICMHNLTDFRKFEKDMEMKEIQYFGGSRGPLQSEPSSKYDTLDARQPSPLKLPDPGQNDDDFKIERNGVSYRIQIADDTEKKKRYNIVVTNCKDSTDRDYLSIAQISMFYDELQQYLDKNLKIYTDASNYDRISYLALTDSHKMYEASKSIRDNKRRTGKDRYGDKQANESPPMGIVRKQATKTVGNIAEFDMQRGNTDYKVKVQCREDNGRLHITVTNADDKNDSDYLMIIDPQMGKDQLIQDLKQRIIVFTKPSPKDSDELRVYIDHIALSFENDGVRRSMSIGTSNRPLGSSKLNQSITTEVSKKHLVKNRARQVSKNHESINSSVSVKSSLTTEAFGKAKAKDEENQWRLLHDEKIILDNEVLTVQLFEKQDKNTDRPDRYKKPPVAQTKSDIDWYKINMYRDTRQLVLASMVLKPSECFRLLNAEANEYQKTKIGLRDLQKIRSVYEKSQIEGLAKQCRFETHIDEWSKLMKSAFYVQSTQEIKFNLSMTDQPSFASISVKSHTLSGARTIPQSTKAQTQTLRQQPVRQVEYNSVERMISQSVEQEIKMIQNVEEYNPLSGDGNDMRPIPNPILHIKAGELQKDNIKQAFKEKKAAAPIQNVAKGFKARKLVNDMKQEQEVKIMQAHFKVEASASGLNRSVFLKLTLKAVQDEQNVTLNLRENIGAKRTVIQSYVLPSTFTGPISDPDEVDGQLSILKDKCIAEIKKYANEVVGNGNIPLGMFQSNTYTPSGSMQSNIESRDFDNGYLNGKIEPVVHRGGRKVQADHIPSESAAESENSLYFDDQDADFNHQRGKNMAVKIAQRIIHDQVDTPLRDEDEVFSEMSDTIKQAVGAVKGTNGHYYRFTIEIIGNEYTLTLIMDRGQMVCKKQTIPHEFVFFEQNQDEEKPIILQACKERVEALIRGHDGEIESNGGQIRDDFFDTSKIPQRVDRSL